MKKQIPGFLSGVLATLLVGSLSVGALAATGCMTITVDPINIQVNGQTFQPKDEQGNDVPVFAYNGTTYAPLRALAEAYGLTVGYDQEANMATVGEATPTDPPAPAAVSDYSDWSPEEEAAYQEFKGMWTVELQGNGDKKYRIDGSTDDTPWEAYRLVGGLSYAETSSLLESMEKKGFISRFAKELRSSDIMVEMYFYSESGAVFGFTVK